MRLQIAFAAIAVACLSAPASASPFSLNSSTDLDGNEDASESSSLMDSVLNATANAFGVVFKAGDKQDEDIVLRFYRKTETCETKEAVEPQPETEPEKKKAMMGPEPIYFGF